jgi:homoserine kinase type II
VDGIAQILSAWPVGPALSTTRMDTGSNNQNWALRTDEGEFCLRVYQNQGAEEHLVYEHQLLQALDQVGLPFAVPVPISTANGETSVLTPNGTATVARRISGEHPQKSDLEQVRAAGRGLAALDRALTQVSLPVAVAVFGDLSTAHPAVAGPDEVIALLKPVGADRRRFEEAVGASEGAWPGLVAALPTQVIHADYCRPNVLMVDGAVSGVLDFEFSGPDLRVMDLAVGLWQFCLRDQIGQDETAAKARTSAFFAGYSEVLTLSEPELAAIPACLVRRQLVGGLHWLGRWKIGLSSEDEARERLTSLSDLVEWLDQGGSEVLGLLAAVPH